MKMKTKFDEASKDWGGKNDVYEIDDKHLILLGGGDFYSDYNSPIDKDTVERAKELANKYGKIITNQRGEWYGYSEYTPDPGDVSVFYWEDE